VSVQLLAASDLSAAPVVATALMLVGAYAAYQDDAGDPRPKCDDPVGC